MHTSSRFEVFALLALSEVWASLTVDSSLGRGMPDVSVYALWGRAFLGVPRWVPADDMAATVDPGRG